MSGRTKKTFFLLFVALLPLLEAIGDHSGNTVRIVMAVLMTLAVIGLIYFAIVSVISDVRAKREEGGN